MKRLRIYRCAPHIKLNVDSFGDCMAREAAKAINRPVSDIFHSRLMRALQTSSSMSDSHYFATAHKHPGLIQLGGAEIAKWLDISPTFTERVKAVGLDQAIEELSSMNLEPTYKGLRRRLLDGLLEIFQLMKGDFGVAISHSPLIQILLHEFDRKPTTFPPLSYAEFTFVDIEGQNPNIRDNIHFKVVCLNDKTEIAVA